MIFERQTKSLAFYSMNKTVLKIKFTTEIQNIPRRHQKCTIPWGKMQAHGAK